MLPGACVSPVGALSQKKKSVTDGRTPDKKSNPQVSAMPEAGDTKSRYYKKTSFICHLEQCRIKINQFANKF